MTVEAALAELTTRIDDLEADLGGRVAVLERRLATSDPAAGQAGPAPVSPQVGAQAPPPQPSTTSTPWPTSASPTSPPPPPPSALPPAAAGGPTPPPPPAPLPPSTPALPPPPAPSRPGGLQVAMRSFGLEDVLRIAGVLLVGLAAVFLVSTAISRGWIGPELQLLGATLIGFSMFGGSLYLVDTRKPWATTFAVGGSAVVTTCAGAAYAWLELFGPVPALMLVATATALSVAVASRIRSEVAAIAATVAMLIVPPVASIVADGPVLATGIWLGLFAIVAMVVGVAQRWPLYRLLSTWAAAFWVIVLAGTLAVDNNSDHLVAGSILVAVVGSVLWIGPVLGERLVQASSIGGGGASGRQARLLALEHRGAAAIPIWAWQSVVLLGGFDQESVGAAIGLAMAAGFVLVAVAARTFRGWISEIGLVSHLLGAGLLVTVALLLWLDGPVLMVGLAAQGLVTLVLAYYFSDVLLKLYGIFMTAVAWLMVMGDMGEVVQSTVDGAVGAPAGDQVARGIAVLLLAVSAWLVAQNEDDEVGELAFGVVWASVLLFATSLISHLVEDRAWLIVGVVAALASLVAGVKLGRVVGGIGAAIGLVTVFVAAVGIVVATSDVLDGGVVAAGDHLIHLVVVLALALVTAGVWLRQPSVLRSPMFVATWAMALGWLASVLVGFEQGQVAVSALWALAACGAIVAGLVTVTPIVRVVGFVTLGVVLVKLLTVDLAEVETFWRVGLFLVIGLGLLRLGYVLPSLAARYATPEATPEAEVEVEVEVEAETETEPDSTV